MHVILPYSSFKGMVRVMKVFLMRKKVCLLLAAALILPITFGGITPVSSVQAEGEQVLVEPQSWDINEIPDKYNTGVSGTLTKYVGVEAKDADIDQCTPIITKTETGTFNIGIKKSEYRYVIDFGAKQNAALPDKAEICDYDFTGFTFTLSRADSVKSKRTLIFRNCIIDELYLDYFERNQKFEFYNCKIRRLKGSDAYFDHCFFGGSVDDPLVPFRNVEVRNCYFSDLNYAYKGTTHIDCTQIFGHSYKDKTTKQNVKYDAQNISYKNCRFEVPNIAFENNKATVNACVMIQLEFSAGHDITVEDCFLNGGVYSVFARGVGNDGDIYDVNIKNNYIGVAASFGAAYPDIDPDANFENTQGTDFLYISSVYKENGKTYFTVTNDTARERKLKIITSSGSYDFTVSACPEGRKYEGGFTCSLADFPIDLSYDIPEECAYAVCLDVTDERNVKQIRFVNYTGSPVYIDKSLLGTGYNSEVVLAEGPFGDNLTYNVTRTASNEYILTISGEGAMPGYTKVVCPPWDEYSEFIDKIIVEEGVENIGQFAFYRHISASEIELPSTITEIGKYAFCKCNSINKMNIPESVASIGEYAFNGVQHLSIEGIPISASKDNGNASNEVGSETNTPEQSTVTPSNEDKENVIPRDQAEKNNQTDATENNQNGASNQSGADQSQASGAEHSGDNQSSEGQGTTSYSSEWIDGKWYNADGSQTYPGIMEWKSNSKGWWIEDTTGWYPVSMWQKINGYWYYFDASGYMASSEWVDGYWLSSDGAWDYPETGSWSSDKNGWWYGDTSGWYASSRWQKIDGYWYYFNNSGYIVTNKYIDGYWLNSNGQYSN